MRETTILQRDPLDLQVEATLQCIEVFTAKDNETRLQLECSFKELLDVCRECPHPQAKNVRSIAEKALSCSELTKDLLQHFHLALQLSIL